MSIFRLLTAFLASAATAYVFASAFYTSQVIAAQSEFSFVMTRGQQLSAYGDNLLGLAPTYGVILTVTLLIGFAVAAGVKRVLVPLAPIAYPVAGAVAVFVMLWMVENLVISGGVGVLAGARGLVGTGLQMLAGALGGIVFAILRARTHQSAE